MILHGLLPQQFRHSEFGKLEQRRRYEGQLRTGHYVIIYSQDWGRRQTILTLIFFLPNQCESEEFIYLTLCQFILYDF